MPDRIQTSSDARCPACGYDVSEILRSGKTHCPECGAEVDEWNAHPALFTAALRRDAAIMLGICTAYGVLCAVGMGLYASAGRTSGQQIIGGFLCATIGLLFTASAADAVNKRARRRTGDRRAVLIFPVLATLGMGLMIGCFFFALRIVSMEIA